MKPARSRFGTQHALWVTCETCGKRAYDTRGDARATLKRMRGKGGVALNVYQCGKGWHVGHLPAGIRHGRVTRGKVYGSKGEQ